MLTRRGSEETLISRTGGAIANLSNDSIVKSPCIVDKRGITPQPWETCPSLS
ncbi:MAG: hypothetical protein J7J17_01400 [Hadesarchaea archaeon]|nr:hypothetical protein [Hadesarchaea archaeon]